MPETSVIIIRTDAFKPEAIAAAAESAFTLNPFAPSSEAEIGAIIGVICSLSSCKTCAGSTRVTLPTKPTSCIFPSTNILILSAKIVGNSRAEMEWALTPAFCSAIARAGPTSLTKTFSTISKTCCDVTLNPATHWLAMPSLFSASFI